MSTVDKDKVNIVQTVIAGAVLAMLSWNVFTTYELTKNQTLLLWRVEQLDRAGNAR